MIQPALADAFAAQGHVRLAGFHPAKRMAPLRRQVQDALSRLGIGGDRKHQRASSSLSGLTPFQQIARLSTLVKIPGLEAAMVTPELLAIMRGLAQAPLSPPGGMQLLLSPPHQGEWSHERLNWHVDVAADPPDRLPGIQVFVLIDDVAPHGGATLALAGSHRPDAVRGATAQAPNLRALLRSADGLEARLQERGMSILEMSGRAGDVFLMDMRLLHTPSVNATKSVRMMATARYFTGGR
jgi:hypothetical protein